MAILIGRDHNSILLAGSGILLGCRGTTKSHNFLTPREILVNLELLRKETQMSPYSDSNLGPHTQHILCITQDNYTTPLGGSMVKSWIYFMFNGVFQFSHGSFLWMQIFFSIELI